MACLAHDPATATLSDIVAFIHETAAEDLPAPVETTLRRCLLDTLAAALAGSATPTAEALRRYATRRRAAPDAPGQARLIFDGRRCDPVAAALVAAGSIDSIDIHDGYALAKGHAGAAVLPALLAACEVWPPARFGEVLAALAVGYEVALRAGVALHALSPVYQTSGAWNALGAAAVAARLGGFGTAATASALGAAGFYAPRGAMMPVIARPSMLKDGSQAGAAVGLEAAFLAEAGFAAGPPEVVTDPEAAPLWTDLGQRWRAPEQYLKPYPVCRWAQPAIEAAARLRPDLTGHEIAAVRVETFAAAVALGGAHPDSSDAAQYALAFPVAAYLCRGCLGVAELTPEALADPAILALAERVHLIESPAFEACFPAERWCRMTVTLTDGTRRDSGPVTTRGDPATPLPDTEIAAKLAVSAPAGAETAAADLAARCLDAPADQDAKDLFEAVLKPWPAA